MPAKDKSLRKPPPPIVSRLKLYCAFWVFLIVVFSAIVYIQNGKSAKLSSEIDRLNTQLRSASNERQSLRETIDFNKSDKYIEDYAHNEFGLVHPNEIIIYNDSYKPQK